VLDSFTSGKPHQSFHWYPWRQNQQDWQLIEGREGTTYVVTTADLDQAIEWLFR